MRRRLGRAGSRLEVEDEGDVEAPFGPRDRGLDELALELPPGRTGPASRRRPPRRGPPPRRPEVVVDLLQLERELGPAEGPGRRGGPVEPLRLLARRRAPPGPGAGASRWPRRGAASRAASGRGARRGRRWSPSSRRAAVGARPPPWAARAAAGRAPPAARARRAGAGCRGAWPAAAGAPGSRRGPARGAGGAASAPGAEVSGAAVSMATRARLAPTTDERCHGEDDELPLHGVPDLRSATGRPGPGLATRSHSSRGPAGRPAAASQAPLTKRPRGGLLLPAAAAHRSSRRPRGGTVPAARRADEATAW